MIEANARVKIQPFFDKFGKFLVHYKIAPNFITLLSFITGVFAGFFIAINYLLFALCLLWLSGLFDVMDGTVARLSKQTAKIGAYIDLISDRMVESAVILGFTFLMPQNYLAYILFLISVIFHFSTFLVAGALFRNDSPKSMYYDKSLVERAEAFIIFSLMMILKDYSFYILMFFTSLVFVCGITRFFRVIEYANNSKYHI